MFELIDGALKKQGISYSQLADKIGVSVNAIYEWRKGSYNPKIDKLKAISDVLEIPLEELIK